MTTEEAQEKCKILAELNLDYWYAQTSSNKHEIKSMFKSCWKSIQNAGFKILKYKEMDNSLGIMVPKFKVREDRSEDYVSIVDNRAEGGNHKGDCTTRCISFCTGVDYLTIQKEQFANLAKAKAGWNYGLTWRSPKIWTQSLFTRGFCELVLPRKVSRKVFLRMFKDSGIDHGIIATKSSGHVAAIDMKTKKILDTWNSAGGRIISIFVPVADKQMWVNKINSILG